MSLGFPLPLSQLHGHQRMEDLVLFDGPVLAHYIDGTHHFLYFWADADDIANRWMIIPIRADQYRAFIEGSMSLYELIQAANGGFVMLLDLDNELRKTNLTLLSAVAIPSEYMPDRAYVYAGKPKSAIERQFTFAKPDQLFCYDRVPQRARRGQIKAMTGFHRFRPAVIA